MILRSLGYLLLLAGLAGLVIAWPVLWELALVGALGGAYFIFFAPPASRDR